MATDNIHDSQQQSEGKTIGTQGNDDMKVPQGTQGSHHDKHNQDDRHIPNQERSSASNMDKAGENRGSE